jgi:hypothetical protein
MGRCGLRYSKGDVQHLAPLSSSLETVVKDGGRGADRQQDASRFRPNLSLVAEDPSYSDLSVVHPCTCNWNVEFPCV